MSSKLVLAGRVQTGNSWAERFRALYEQAPDMSFAVEPGTGKIVDCNRRVQALLGYAPAELLGRRITSLAHPDTPPAGWLSWEAIAACGELADADLQVLRSDGTKLDVSAGATPVCDERGGLVRGLTVWRDISRRRQVECELLEQQRQLRTLAQEICMAEERERRRIAAGLHDEIGQLLVIARLKLGELGEVAKRREDRGLLEELRGLLDQASRVTRSATFELSSVVLHKLGLEAAIESLGERMQRVYGLCFHLERDDRPLALSEDKLVVLFRAVRELLFNVHKHAQAQKATVAICRVGEQALIRIEDNGVGFEPRPLASQFDASGGFGLFSVSAQIQAIGGRMEVSSAPGAGTRVAIYVPVPEWHERSAGKFSGSGR